MRDQQRDTATSVVKDVKKQHTQTCWQPELRQHVLPLVSVTKVRSNPKPGLLPT